MAELADALGSGPSGGNFLGVQVPFRVIFLHSNCLLDMELYSNQTIVLIYRFFTESEIF